MELRIGHGIDVHAFGAGRPMIIGGVRIPHEKGLVGHSDADVLLHALIDALLGAAGLPDIGTLFPDTDATWNGISSVQLLKRTWERVAGLGWRVVNLDATVLAEVPKISPFRAQMQDCIASVLQISPACCGIKATTTEKLGFVGRKEGILASCVVLLQRD